MGVLFNIFTAGDVLCLSEEAGTCLFHLGMKTCTSLCTGRDRSMICALIHAQNHLPIFKNDASRSNSFKSSCHIKGHQYERKGELNF